MARHNNTLNLTKATDASLRGSLLPFQVLYIDLLWKSPFIVTQFKAQHGKIVELRSFAHEFINAALDPLDDSLRGFIIIRLECL